MKEILLYQPIYSSTAIDYINQMEAAKNSDISIRMNCPGGDVYAAYGMIAKFNEHTKGKSIQVDGMAKSGGFYMCCAAGEVKCLSVSDFMAHRAALPDWVEKDPKMFTPEVKDALTKINTDLRAIAESKVNATLFQTVTGTSYDTVFSLDSRVDVRFTATQAKAMGLVKEIIPLTAAKKSEIMALASSNGIAAFSNEPVINEEKNKIMTAAELKSANPTAYAEIIAEGAKAEKTRVKTWMAYEKIDPAAVAAGIKSGEECTEDVKAEFMVKALSAGVLGKAKEENAEDIKTGGTAAVAEPTAEEKNRLAFFETCKKDLGLTK